MIGTTFFLVMKDIFKDVMAYLPVSVVLGVGVCMAYLIVAKSGRNNTDFKMSELIILFMLSVYLVAVLYITIFSRTAKDLDYYDLSYLFLTVKRSPDSVAGMVENGFLFVPLGILLPMAIPEKFKNLAILSQAGRCLAL